MFKKGDIVESLIDSSSGNFTKGNQYTVKRDMIGVYVLVECNDSGKATSMWHHSNFKLVATRGIIEEPIQSPKREFKVGDLIQANCATNSIDIVEEIVQVKIGKLYKYRGVNHAGCGQGLEEYMLKNFKLIKENPPITSIAVKSCSCSSFDLFNKGCKCGAIIKKQWGLSG